MATLVVRLSRTSRGQIVAVAKDGHRFGLAEQPPDFGFVHLPGIRPSRLRRFVARNDGPEAWKYHWQIPLDSAPQRLLDKLASPNGVVVGVDVTLDQLKAALYHQRDRRNATGETI